MKDDTVPAITWRKSTRSNTDGQCVEVADVPRGQAVRDSKDRDGTALTFPTAAWAAFSSGVKDGQFD